MWALFTSLRENEHDVAKLDRLKKMIQLFVQYNLDVNSPDDGPDFFSPLGYSILLNIPPLFNMLIELGADVNQLYTYHERPVLIQLIFDLSKKFDMRNKQEDVNAYVKNRITMLNDLVTNPDHSSLIRDNLTVEICDRSDNSATNININGHLIPWKKVYIWIKKDLNLQEPAEQFHVLMKRIDEKSHDFRCQVFRKIFYCNCRKSLTFNFSLYPKCLWRCPLS